MFRLLREAPYAYADDDSFTRNGKGLGRGLEDLDQIKKKETICIDLKEKDIYSLVHKI